jgi:hypothetical protein
LACTAEANIASIIAMQMRQPLFLSIMTLPLLIFDDGLRRQTGTSSSTIR